jgi:transketolase
MPDNKKEIAPTPALVPLSLPNKLAPTPTQAPRYSVRIKNASGQEVVVADPRATRALVALMDLHAVIGGAACHWGGPSAFAEIMAAAHAIMFSVKGRQWYEAYNFVNDAGHTENGVYALRSNYGFDGMSFESLKGFRSFNSKLTGHGESHINPEGVFLSNGPLGSALPQAQGLAMADRVSGNDRVTLCTVSDGACMEGEAKEALSALPGFAARGKVNPFVLLLSDNNTKLSGRIDKDSFSMQPSFEALSVLGWTVIKVEKGNCLESVYQAVEKGIGEARANPLKPVCIWFKTTKGKGVKSTEDSSSGGHGYPLQNAEKIVDFLAEIYSGFEYLPVNFGFGPKNLMSSGCYQRLPKKQSRLLLQQLKRRKSRLAWQKVRLRPPAKVLRSIPFAAMFKVQPGSLSFKKHFRIASWKWA